MNEHLTILDKSSHAVSFLFSLSGIIGTSVASLLITIEEMHVLSKKMFFNSLSLHASRLMDKVNKLQGLIRALFIMKFSPFTYIFIITISYSKEMENLKTLMFHVCCKIRRMMESENVLKRNRLYKIFSINAG